MFQLLRNDASRFGIGKTESVPVNEILCVVGEGNYSWLYIKKRDKPILMSITIKKLHESFPSFVRVHKRYLLNLDHLLSYQQVSPYAAVVRLRHFGFHIPIAKRRLPDILFIAREREVKLPGISDRAKCTFLPKSLFDKPAPSAIPARPLSGPNRQEILSPNDIGKLHPGLGNGRVG